MEVVKSLPCMDDCSEQSGIPCMCRPVYVQAYVSAGLCICRLVSAAAPQPVEGDASVSSWGLEHSVEPVLRTERSPGALKMVETS